MGVFAISYELNSGRYSFEEKESANIDTLLKAPNVVAVAFSEEDAIKITQFYNDDMADNG